jgi:hypothetical protein
MSEVANDVINLIGELQTLANVLKKGKGKPKKTLHDVSEQLQIIANEADPVRQPTFMFDPSDPQMIGRITACVLLLQPRLALKTLNTEKFYGSGIYALYYTGNFGPYHPISGKETPIYVGKADPAVPGASTPRLQGVKLSDRLNEHRKNIAKITNVSIDDFECRYMVVKSGMQIAAENYLIHYFHPIWNKEMKICFGIGKHGDKASTRGNSRSPWDVMHSGRGWAAESTTDQKTYECIVEDIKAHFAKFPPIKKIDYDRLLMGA